MNFTLNFFPERKLFCQLYHEFWTIMCFLSKKIFCIKNYEQFFFFKSNLKNLLEIIVYNNIYRVYKKGAKALGLHNYRLFFAFFLRKTFYERVREYRGDTCTRRVVVQTNDIVRK